VGVSGVILFGVPESKDEMGSGAWDPQGISQVALRSLRNEFGDDVVLMADLCLDEYTTHGHCGVLRSDGSVDNDATIELYARVALAQAEAGAAVVAPSGMMDGQVGAIRNDSTKRASMRTIFWPTPRSTRVDSTAPFATRSASKSRAAAIARPINKTRTIAEKPCSKRAPTSSKAADIVMVKPAMTNLGRRQ